MGATDRHETKLDDFVSVKELNMRTRVSSDDFREITQEEYEIIQAKLEETENL